MLTIDYVKYVLEPVDKINAEIGIRPREGALLRFQWPNNRIGYSDCFPWPEWGDDDLDHQLIGLSRGRLSPLAEQSMWLAKRDSLARTKGVSLFKDLPKVKNHFLIQDYNRVNEMTLRQIKTSGFTTIKLKVGRNIDEESRWVSKIISQENFLIRLDFNSIGDFSLFERFMSPLSASVRSHIEFVEDPFPYDSDSWKEGSKLVKLAIDQEYEKNFLKISEEIELIESEKKGPNIKIQSPRRLPFSVVILKPARRDVENMVNLCKQQELKIVVTSSMDHSVGILHSLNIASDLKKNHPTLMLDAGCLSVNSYRYNDLTFAIPTVGCYLGSVPGIGIGYEDFFDKLAWKNIRGSNN